jgi:hypothetical protein
MSTEDDVRRARDFFASLKLAEWKEHTDKPKKGGQAIALVVKHRDGALGVFRHLHSGEQSDLARFFREVELLTKPEFQHASIIKLLAWTTDGAKPWYISKLGRSFADWWENFRAANERTPAAIVTKAVEFLLSITAGLAPLHKAGCVHRDIKPPNLIVTGDRDSVSPVLIDFGLVYIDGAERLTDPREAVGNRRFSPDVAMNRMDSITPWLDVFQLSQLLMWMVANRAAKEHWQRPVDSRFVKYPSDLPPETVTALQAVTAMCSEESLAPKYASELHNLLRERFPTEQPRPAAQAIRFDVHAIQTAMAAGKSEVEISISGDHRLIVMARPDAERFYAEVELKLDQLIATAQEQDVDCKRMGSENLTQFLDVMLGDRNRMNCGQVYEIQCGKFGTPATFTVGITCFVYVPSRLHDWPPLPETSSILVFGLHTHGNVVKGQFPSVQKRITLERDGRLTLRKENMQVVRAITIDDLVQEVKALMENPEAWKALHRDRHY